MLKMLIFVTLFIAVCAIAYRLGSAIKPKPKRGTQFQRAETSTFQEASNALSPSKAPLASLPISTSLADPPQEKSSPTCPKPDAAATTSPQASRINSSEAPVSPAQPAPLSEDLAARFSANLRNAGEDNAGSLLDRAIAAMPNVASTHDPLMPPRVASPVPAFTPNRSVPTDARTFQAPDVAATLGDTLSVAELQMRTSPQPSTPVISTEPKVVPDVRATVAPGTVVTVNHPAPLKFPERPLSFEGVRPDVRATLAPA